MKRYITLLFALLVFAGCDEYTNSAERSAITFLPKIEIIGEPFIELPCDATGYEDEGAVATEGGETIEFNTTVKGIYYGGTTVDGPDSYSITYSAENKDGIPGAEVRSVLWPECTGDLNASLAGMYTSSILRTTKSSGAKIDYTDEAFGPIFIRDLGNGTYQISDAIGGFYEYGYGYGSDYASTGMTVTVNNIAANDFTYGDPVGVGAFGGNNSLTKFTVDPATKTIEFTADWDLGFVFEVTLTQVP